MEMVSYPKNLYYKSPFSNYSFFSKYLLSWTLDNMGPILHHPNKVFKKWGIYFVSTMNYNPQTLENDRDLNTFHTENEI